MSLLYYLHLKEKRTADSQYNIVALVQTTSAKEPLQTVYLAELLGLSIDRPINLYHFDLAEGRKKLLACPPIRKAALKKISPGIIFVEYELRKPIASLGECANAAIDETGAVFPVTPFFTPKKLTEFILGDEVVRNLSWGDSCGGHAAFAAAMELLDLCSGRHPDDGYLLRRIDVSRAFDSRPGKREVIVILDEHREKEINGKPLLSIYPSILRLNPKELHQGWREFLSLRSYLATEDNRNSLKETLRGSLVKMPPRVIDLRLPGLAYITSSKN